MLAISVPNPQYPLLVLKWVGDLPAAAAGIITSYYANPNFTFGVDAVNWQDNSQSQRLIASSTTCYFDSSTLYDQGKCYVAQSSFGALGTLPEAFVAGEPLDQRIILGLFPAQASTIMQLSDRYYTGMARDGSFAVEGFTNPAMQYESGQSESMDIQGPFQLSGGGTVTLSLRPGAATSFQAPIFHGFTTSYHLYKGLLNQATIQIKRIHSWEILPNIGSAWGPFASAGPCPDCQALEAAACARYGMRDGAPSAANDLGTFRNLASGLFRQLPNIWKVAKVPIKGALGVLPGGGTMNQILDGIETLGLLNSGGGGKGKAKAAQKLKGNKAPQPVPTAKGSKSARKRANKKMALRKAIDFMESLD